jgi:pyruvate,water dikinase
MLMLAAGTSDYKNLTRSLRPKLAALAGEADANSLLSGRPGTSALASLGPLIGIARLIRGEMTRDEYVEAYGHRGPNEFELSEPTPAERGEWTEIDLQEPRDGDRSVDDLLAEKTRGYAAAWKRFVQTWPASARKWDRRLAAIHRAALTREAVRSEVVRLLRLGRTFALRAAELTGIGEDVFFLSFEEIDRLLAGDRGALASVSKRRSATEQLAALPAYPPLIRGRFDPKAWAADPLRPVDYYRDGVVPPAVSETSGRDPIRGFSGSPGIVEGRVRVLHTIDAASSFEPGEILVARTTNVGWTPLFPRAAAIVTDVGAPLSHAAIVARELGIPAVVGTGTATTRLSTGDRVRVDGARGLVTIL